MQPDHSVKIEEILLRYENKVMTKALRNQLTKEVMPLLGDLSEHLDRWTTFNRENRQIDIVLKAKTPLGKILLERLGDGAKEVN